MTKFCNDYNKVKAFKVAILKENKRNVTLRREKSK